MSIYQLKHVHVGFGPVFGYISESFRGRTSTGTPLLYLTTTDWHYARYDHPIHPMHVVESAKLILRHCNRECCDTTTDTPHQREQNVE
jgi:hypothetical protein